MRVVSRSAFFALLFSAFSDAVSLSDMTPRAENLPSDCERIYDSQISGCGVSDFTTQSCTDTCVKALQAMVGPIKEACGGQGVTGQNLVVAFLANVGPQQICPNADLSSSSTAQSSPSPSPSPTSTSAPSPSDSEASSSSVQSTSLLVDTSSGSPTRTRTRTPAFSGTTTAPPLSQSQTTTTTMRAELQSSSAAGASAPTSSSDAEDGVQEATGGDHSGGGSPFDDEGNMFSGADSLSSTSVLVSLGIAMVVAVFLFR